MAEPKTNSKARKPVEGTDVTIIVDVFVPGHEPFQERLTLKNYTGNTLPPERTPINFRIKLYEALRKAFGVEVG